MKLVNCTPHTIALVDGAGIVTYYPGCPVGRHAQAAPRNCERITPRGGCLTWLARDAELVGLPAPQEGVYLLVDAAVAMLATQLRQERWDLLAVDPETAVQLPGDPYQVAYRSLVCWDGSAVIGLGLASVG